MMATVKPFKALRFNEEKAGKLKELVCPPYDIISEEQRKSLVSKNQFNMVNLELPKGENMYEDAANLLKEWQKDEILKQDNKNSIYIYEEEFTVKGETKKIKGFICLVKIEEFSKNVVLPHEETLSKAKTDRFNLMSTTFCNFSQIYSLYLDDEKNISPQIDTLSNEKPNIEFATDDGIIQRMWLVDDENAIEELTEKFNNKQLFIADGHHRYETALNFKNKLTNEKIITEESQLGNYVMMMLVDMDHEGLVVFPTHRLVKDLENFNIKRVLEGLDDKLEIEGTFGHFSIDKIKGANKIEALLDKNVDKKVFAMYVGNDEFYFITLTDSSAMSEALPEKCDAYKDLDVSVLHSLILEPIFGIDKENMAKQINLTYTRELNEAISGVDNGSYQCSFILNPTKVREIKDVALAGEKMPQKSTYFYPKIITGLVINKLMEIPE